MVVVKICPILLCTRTINDLTIKDTQCIEEDCAWFSITHNVCGMRLSLKGDMI